MSSLLSLKNYFSLASDGKGLTKGKIEEFFDSGRNVFIATDVDASKGIRLLYNEFGFDLNEFVTKWQQK